MFEFEVLPFGLCNAPATFEKLVEIVLAGLHWETCLVYIDDIIVCGKTFDEMLKNLDDVFLRLQGAGLKLKARKCQLFVKGFLKKVLVQTQRKQNVPGTDQCQQM